MSSLVKALNLTNEERRSLEKTVGRVRSVSEFLSDAVDAVKDLDFVEAVQKASPWAEAVGRASGSGLCVLRPDLTQSR